MNIFTKKELEYIKNVYIKKDKNFGQIDRKANGRIVKGLSNYE